MRDSIKIKVFLLLKHRCLTHFSVHVVKLDLEMYKENECCNLILQSGWLSLFSPLFTACLG